ncbi:D-cysteine desulfhydrase [Nitzschia inconspicua]|uniref:D-cysteine desulfhydrase n=1 Tax=Nitzschia inconspicua TaxID=303405 RepID=A0A9K3LDZ3_9STRA|nr:D-cysteine desulfhydrase [Nitzschia inconspicua]
MELSRFPRRKYTPYVTPIEPMNRLSQELGGSVNLFIKRDDQLGLTGGGNKTRKLEFAMADALLKGADTIITCGAVQSNHCRLTLSACIQENLKCILVLEERVPGSYHKDASGNNYLFQLLGAEQIVVVGLGEAPQKVQEMAAELREAQGRNVYCVPGGASNEIGALGYCACAAEIQNQIFEDTSLPRMDYLVTASGSGGTHAGLAAAMYALRSSIKVVGISTRHPEDVQTAHIHALADKTLKFATGDGTLDLPTEKVVVKDAYVGPGYSLPTEGMQEAVTLFARKEGILLDPVYTGKAAAGLIDLVRSNYFEPGSNVLFLHTGGAPSLYHYMPIDTNLPVAGATSKVANDSDEKKSD